MARGGGRKSNWSGWPLRRSARGSDRGHVRLVLGVAVVRFNRRLVVVQDGCAGIS